MDPEIIKAALQQVIDNMGGSAKAGLANKLMGAPKPGIAGQEWKTGAPDDMPPEDCPPDMMAGKAGMAAAGDEMPPDDEAAEGEDPNAPSDDELEEMLKDAK